jgi:DNA-binding transcriptional regulator YiaG
VSRRLRKTGRRRPARIARILLAIIEKNPSVVHDTLAG